MGAGEAAVISATLIVAGKPAATPVVIVENASLPNSSHVCGALEELPLLAELGSGGPALILIGEVYREAVQMKIPQHARVSA